MILLPQDFYLQDTKTVAKNLLGKILHVNIGPKEHKARIVEVEAYLGKEDPACHTFGGRNTERVRSMYMEGGHSYVYFIYGMYHCLNVVTRDSEHPEAVLIRAVQPLEISSSGVRKKDLKTNGPGKLCKHYGISKDHDGLRLWKRNSALFICEDESEVKKPLWVSTTRVGVDYAGNAASWPLRFYLKDNLFISRP